MRGLRRVIVDFNAWGAHPREWLTARPTDVNPPAQVGDELIAYEPYDIRARARVAEIDETKNLMYLEIDWDSFEEEGDLPTEPSSARA